MSNYICEELIFEIFTRLPPKSLLRFRSLSKSWYSCIGSHDFIRMHTFRSSQKFLIKHRQDGSEDCYALHSEDQLPFCPGRGYIGRTPFEFPCDKYFSINIYGSCNGILCLSDYNKKRISLWNPSIRRKLTLPDCPWRYFYGVAIGFGFDRITDDYKLVIVPNTRDGGIVKSSYVYALKTAAWCVIASPTPLFFKVTSEACFLNEALHWVVESNDLHRRSIMTFDLSTHVFGRIALPKPGWETSGLTTIQGSLAMISYRIDHVDSWIWLRRDDTWSVVFKSKPNHFGEAIARVWQLNNSGDLLFKTCDDRLQVFNPERGSLSTVVRLAASFLDEQYIVPCAESLQLLDVGTDC